MKNKILVIVGQTASGKSGLGIKLAKKFNGEIISADSRQVYKGLNIGAGKVTKKEMDGITHHLLDVEDPKKNFSASDYKILGLKAIEKIIDKNRLPIIVGGTGFYIDALVGISSLPEVPPNLTLRKKFKTKSIDELFKLLSKKDPRRAVTIDSKNKVRLIRALEIIEVIGKVPEIKKNKSPYKFIFIGLKIPQVELDKKIKKRLLERLNQGMIKEVESLHKKGLSFNRMYSLGLEYRYVALFLQKKLTKQEMIDKLFIEIRKYSKRQMTWFKRNKEITWFDPNNSKLIFSFVALSIQK